MLLSSQAWMPALFWCWGDGTVRRAPGSADSTLWPAYYTPNVESTDTSVLGSSLKNPYHVAKPPIQNPDIIPHELTHPSLLEGTQGPSFPYLANVLATQSTQQTLSSTSRKCIWKREHDNRI